MLDYQSRWTRGASERAWGNLSEPSKTRAESARCWRMSGRPGLVMRLLQLAFLLANSDSLLVPVFCDRPDPKIETKVEIEITYQHRTNEDKFQKHDSHKISQFVYNIHNLSKPLTSDVRAIHRQSSPNLNSNSGASPRHGYRFTTIDKGAGPLTMSTYDSDSSDSGLRMRNHMPVVGKLIHVVTLYDNKHDNSPVPSVHTACSDIINPVSSVWVALIQDGSCSLDYKLKMISKLANHPQAVIVYGDSKSEHKQDPYLSFNQDIPMVIFFPWNNIKGVVQRCYNSSGQITIPPDLLPKLNKSSIDGPISSHNNCNVSIKVVNNSDDNFLNKTSVLFVSISFILLMVISLAWLMFYYVQRFRYIHTKEQFSRRLAHMAKKAVAKIPVKTLKQGDRETDPDLDNCAICIECYKPSDTVRILPCKHYFHKSCIDPWLLEQRSCPMCKLNILHAYGFLPNERGSIISEDHLSELDSSLELQFMSGNIGPPIPSTSTRVQAYCQARDNNYVNVATLPSIFTEPGSHNTNRWSSLLLKRPRVGHRIDRSVSLRHLNGNAEERITFLSHNRLLSHSATDTIVTIQDPFTPPSHVPNLQWHHQASTSVTAATEPGSQTTVSSH